MIEVDTQEKLTNTDMTGWAEDEKRSYFEALHKLAAGEVLSAERLAGHTLRVNKAINKTITRQI